jgi:hypothetical protein
MYVKLVELQDYHGRLVDDLGKPIAKASVAPTSFCGGEFHRPNSPTGYGWLPPCLSQKMTVTTSADGAFVLRGVPSAGITTATIAGNRAQIVSWRLGKPLTIVIPRPGSVSGSVVPSEGAGPLDGIRLWLSRSPDDRAGRSPSDSGEFIISDAPIYVGTQKGGTFCFSNVSPGKYALSCGIGLDEGAYYLPSPATVEVKPDEAVAGVTVPLRRAIAVRGKVVDQRSGAGIPDVSLQVFSFSGTANEGPMVRSATTDAEGGFTADGREGKVTVYVERAPQNYAAPSPRTPALSADVGRNTTLPPISLDPLATLEGIVVDESGHTVANAEILQGLSRPTPDLPHSDEAGRFAVRWPSSQQISIRIRTDKAIADPISVKACDVKGPLRVVVSEKSAFAACGTVVDDAGQRVPGCQIGLKTNWTSGFGAIGGPLALVASDREGRFRIGGLWPRDPYKVELQAKGYDKGSSPEVHGSPGEVHDFGKLLVRRIGGVMEGKVVDTSGKAIDAVRVFNRGDGPELAECQSDPAGRFHLAGLHYGPVYIFAEKEGYRFTRLRATAGTAAATLTMLRRDEPLPQQPRAESVPPQEQRRLARELLVKLWTVRTEDTGVSLASYMAEIDPQQGRKWLVELWHARTQRTATSLVSTMADIDTELARKWSAEAGGKYDCLLRWMAAEKLAETDLDEVMTMPAQQDDRGYSWFKRLADHFAASDTAKARRLAEEAAVRARAIRPPGNMTALAEVGVLLIHLGNAEAGRKLLGEAAEAAAKLSAPDAHVSTLREVATALAPYNLDRALKLTDRISDRGERNLARARLAAACDTRDADRLLPVLKDMDAFYGDRARFRLAYRVAATRPRDAMRIVESMPSSPAFGFADETHAQALRWMAEATAPRDKADAYKLVDQAFAVYLGASELYGRRATQTAALAVVAGRIGYPDMESVVSRVLACRATMKNEFAPASVVESSAVMAMLLAIVDPATAAEVLRSLEPQANLIGSGYTGVGGDVRLKAWAVADPKHAMELADRELAKAKGNPGWDGGALIELLDLWTMPRDRRFRYVAGYMHNLAFPDQEL